MWRCSFLLAGLLSQFAIAADASLPPHSTTVSISGEDFCINGEPTFKGRIWNGHRIEGLLPNSRMVQGIFDDLNPETVSRFAYPDTGKWDAERNTREFIAAMPEWRRHGLLAFTAKPILFNEDDHFDFDKAANNFTAATAEHASWGYFDYRMKDEGFDEGYKVCR